MARLTAASLAAAVEHDQRAWPSMEEIEDQARQMRADRIRRKVALGSDQHSYEDPITAGQPAQPASG